jgi:hypothetical protein
MKNFYKAVSNYQSNVQSSPNTATGSSGTSSGTSKRSQQASNQNLNQAVKRASQTGNTNKVTSQVNQMAQSAMTNKNSATRKSEMKNNAGNVMEMLQGAMTEAAHGRKSNGPKARSAMAAVKGYMEAVSPDRAKNADMLNTIQESMNEAAFGGNSGTPWANVTNKMQEAMGSQLSMTAENAQNQIGNQLYEAMQEAMVEQAMAPNIIAMSGDGDIWNAAAAQSDMLSAGSEATTYGDTVKLLVHFGGNIAEGIQPSFADAFSTFTGPNTPRVEFLSTQKGVYENEENHSNLLLACITAEAHPYWGAGDTTLNLGANMYDLLSIDSNGSGPAWTGYYTPGCAFSYTNPAGEDPSAALPDEWPQTNTSIYKLDESFNTGMTSDEKNYLYHKFGYAQDIADFTEDVIQTIIEGQVKVLAESVATDELGNQIINNVVDYGDLKTKHLTSINIAERKQAAPTNVTESSGASWVYLPTP